jgi:hypothetical protein
MTPKHTVRPGPGEVLLASTVLRETRHAADGCARLEVYAGRLVLVRADGSVAVPVSAGMARAVMALFGAE